MTISFVAVWKLRLVYFMLTLLCLFLHSKTSKLSWTYYMLAPGVIFTNFMFRGVYLIGIVYNKFASSVFDLYGTIASMILTSSLSFSVFKTLHGEALDLKTQDFILLLDALVPLLMFLILIVDLVLCIFTVTTPDEEAPSPPIYLQDLDDVASKSDINIPKAQQA